MSDVALIGVDWGSSSVRALAICADGAILDARRAPDGVFVGTGPFGERLRRILGDWLERPAPILLCGMIGSDRGWVHAPYAAAPAGLDELANTLVAAPFEPRAHIVPGLSFVSADTCEVMRGEETLLMGLTTAAHRVTVCLPGTHSKWVDLIGGRIVSFRTHMTGELRAALLANGALATGVPQTPSRDAFLQGFAASQDDAAPTHTLFQARARRLLGALAVEHTESFVSGVLIGAEIARERATVPAASSIILAARGSMADEYGAALSQAGLAFTGIDPEPLAALGLLRIARAASRNGSM